jgi:hypothetical protein
MPRRTKAAHFGQVFGAALRRSLASTIKLLSSASPLLNPHKRTALYVANVRYWFCFHRHCCRRSLRARLSLQGGFEIPTLPAAIGVILAGAHAVRKK